MTLPAGWLSGQEGGALQRLARGGVVLEVGAWLGLSTVTLAQVAKCVVSVDHHRGSAEHQAGGPCSDPSLIDAAGRVDTLPRFRHNLRMNRVDEGVIVIVGDFETVGPLLAPASFDLVFIDADHSTEAVVRHGRLALELVAVGGAIAFHDANWPTVSQALRELRDDGLPDLPFVVEGSLYAYRIEE